MQGIESSPVLLFLFRQSPQALDRTPYTPLVVLQACLQDRNRGAVRQPLLELGQAGCFGCKTRYLEAQLDQEEQFPGRNPSFFAQGGQDLHASGGISQGEEPQVPGPLNRLLTLPTLLKIPIRGKRGNQDHAKPYGESREDTHLERKGILLRERRRFFLPSKRTARPPRTGKT